MTLNKVQLIGFLGADPEARRTNNGKPVVNFRLATSEKWKNRDGERQEHTEWHNVVIFNEGACKLSEYLKKGSQVYVEGQLQTRKWQDKDGNDRYSTEVVVKAFGGELKPLDRKEGGSNGGEEREGHRPSRQERPAREPSSRSINSRADDLDDDIPF